MHDIVSYVLTISYTRKEKDFPSRREYDDYLEELETCVFNLMHGIALEQTYEILEKHKDDIYSVPIQQRKIIANVGDHAMPEPVMQTEKDPSIARRAAGFPMQIYIDRAQIAAQKGFFRSQIS